MSLMISCFFIIMIQPRANGIRTLNLKENYPLHRILYQGCYLLGIKTFTKECIIKISSLTFEDCAKKKEKGRCGRKVVH